MYYQALKYLKDKPGIVAYGPSPSDPAQRFEHVKRCREIFEGAAETLYE